MEENINNPVLLPKVSFPFNIHSHTATETDIHTDELVSDTKVNIFTIDFYTDRDFNETSAENLKNWLVPLFPAFLELVFNQIPFQFNAVERLCVIEPELLGQVIFQIQREKNLKPSWTGQEGHFHTIGKTISYLGEDTQNVTSTVLFNSDYFGPAINAFSLNKPYDEWIIEQQLCYYMLLHEFGHAIDSYTRKEISKSETVSRDEDDWEKLSAHYAPIVVSEFLACAFARKSVTPALQNDFIQNWQHEITQFVQTLVRKRLFKNIEQFEIINVFWVILVQLAKLLGHNHKRDELPTIMFPEDFWEGEEEVKIELESFIEDFSSSLEHIIAAYPEISSQEQIIEMLKPHFLHLSGMYYFYVREEDVPDSQKE